MILDQWHGIAMAWRDCGRQLRNGDAQSAVVHAMIDIADGAVALTDLLFSQFH